MDEFWLKICVIRCRRSSRYIAWIKCYATCHMSKLVAAMKTSTLSFSELRRTDTIVWIDRWIGRKKLWTGGVWGTIFEESTWSIASRRSTEYEAKPPLHSLHMHALRTMHDQGSCIHLAMYVIPMHHTNDPSKLHFLPDARNLDSAGYRKNPSVASFSTLSNPLSLSPHSLHANYHMCTEPTTFTRYL